MGESQKNSDVLFGSNNKYIKSKRAIVSTFLANETNDETVKVHVMYLQMRV